MRRSIAVLVMVVGVVAAACAPQVPTKPLTVRPVTPLPAACPDGGGPAVPPQTITAQNRNAALRAPANYQPGVAYPLLVSLHPFILDHDAWETYSGLGVAAAARGYWVLAPKGSDPGPRWNVPGGLETGIDDIGWIDELIRTAADTVCVDGDRVFAAGFSAGAAMSVGLTCELPGRFAAIAGSGGTNLTTPCPGSGPVDAMILHGTADPIAPPSGNTIEFTPPVGLDVATVVATFATRNACSPTPTTTSLTPSATVDTYACGAHRLEFVSMLGGGHTWAGSEIPLDIVTGPTDRSFSATSLVLDFFGAT